MKVIYSLLLTFIFSCSEAQITRLFFSKGLGGTTPETPFDPATVPDARFVYDPDNAVLDGSNVESLPNSVSGGAEAEKVSDGARPVIISADLNGHDVLDFDGSDKLFADVLDVVTEDMTCFVIFKADATSGATRRNLINNCNASANGASLAIVNNTAEFFWRSAATTSFTNTSDYHIFTAKARKFQNAAVNVRMFKMDNVVGSSTVLSNQLNTTLIHFNIGNNEAANEGFDGKIAYIAFYERVLNETEEQNFYTWANSHFGMSIPTTMPEYTFHSGSLTYSSTFDAITNIGYQFSFSGKVFGRESPILLLGHGYADTPGSFTTTIKARMSNLENGFYLVIPDGRGRNGADGLFDSSGREIYDLYDAVRHVNSIHGDYIDIQKRSMSGYSGGGGWAVATAAKIPNLFAVTVDNFGITDYIYNYTTTAWYEQATPGGAVQQQLELTILGLADRNPADYLNECKSRDHRASSAKNYTGSLYVIHDEDDTAVELVQSEELEDAWITEGATLAGYHISGSGDPNRYNHGYPDAGTNPGLVASEDFWLSAASTEEASTFPTTGEKLVSGFVLMLDENLTVKIDLQLGNGTSAENGKNRTATFEYNYTTGECTITPHLESGATDMTYLYEDDLGRVASGTISSETTFTAEVP